MTIEKSSTSPPRPRASPPAIRDAGPAPSPVIPPKLPKEGLRPSRWAGATCTCRPLIILIDLADDDQRAIAAAAGPKLDVLLVDGPGDLDDLPPPQAERPLCIVRRLAHPADAKGLAALRMLRTKFGAASIIGRLASDSPERVGEAGIALGRIDVGFILAGRNIAECETLISDAVQAAVDGCPRELVRSAFRSRCHPLTHDIIDFVIEHPDTAKSPKALKHQLRIPHEAKVYLANHNGLTLERLMIWVRLGLASAWLLATDKPVKTIAHRLGYPGTSAFTHLFANHLGLSPTDFRRRDSWQAFVAVIGDTIRLR